MSNPELLRKHALDCLRLEADCMQLAGDARNANVQSHFVRMARVWSGLAVSGPGANAGQQLADGKARTA
jgi:hypothetical protein